MVKISRSPVGLAGVTRSLVNAILPLEPGKAASAGFAVTAAASISTPAARANPSSDNAPKRSVSLVVIAPLTLSPSRDLEPTSVRLQVPLPVDAASIKRGD